MNKGGLWQGGEGKGTRKKYSTKLGKIEKRKAPYLRAALAQ